MNQDDFRVVRGFKSYVNKPEITELDPSYLVKGSKNVLIDYASRVISRNGYKLYNQANTGSTGIRSSYEWGTSNGHEYSLRAYADKLEFDYDGSYRVLKSGLPTPYLEFAKIWDVTEKEDILLWVLGDTNTYKWSGGVTKLRSATATTLTKQGVITAQTTIAFIAGTTGTTAARITDSGNNFLNAGFATGDTLYVSGSTSNNRIFTIGSVTAGTITLIMSDVLTAESAGASITLHTGEPTWASSRFLTAGTRKIVYAGVEYTYTGGETTDTLTGLTAFPNGSITLGDVVWQAVITLANPGSISTNFKQDLIAVQLNQLILASTKSQEVYISKNTDYTDFTLTSPRAPADPAKVNMDKTVTCLIPIDNSTQSASALMIGGGKNEFFKLDYHISNDNSNELVRVIKLKTASGSGLISKGAIGNIKNAVAYITREPSLDTLGDVEGVDGKTNVPISDPIKNDFDNYDFTNSHLKYWKRAIYISLPAHGLVLIYDLMRKLWQPPQTIPVGRFAIIDDWLYGHSSITNETYKLFVGTNDNGIQISQVARFAYNNGGRRDVLKNLSQYWTDGYITTNAVLNLGMFLGFDGSAAKKTMTISGKDTSITIPQNGSTIGDESLGTNPLGGETLDPLTGLANSGVQMVRFWQDDTMDVVDYTEHFVEYTLNTLDAQMAIVAHGSNQWSAGTAPVSHKK